MAASYVVDTDVISYLFRRDTRADAYRPYLEGATLAVSFMTVAELDLSALRRNWAADRRERMAAYLEEFVVVLVDRTLCRTWAIVRESGRRNGRPIEVADSWIAATALALDVPLITNNRAHYLGVDNLAVLPRQEISHGSSVSY